MGFCRISFMAALINPDGDVLAFIKALGKPWPLLRRVLLST